MPDNKARTGAEPSQTAAQGALVVLMVFTAILMLILVSPWRDIETPRPGSGTWQQVNVNKEFGQNAYPTVIVRHKSGFVAIGNTVDSAHHTARPAAWSSPNGARWQPVQNARFPNTEDGFTGITAATSYHGVLIAATQDDTLWRSTDAVTWKRVARLQAPDVYFIVVRVGPDGFVVNGYGSIETWSQPVWASTDGIEWAQAQDTGTATNPVGLTPAAPLGDMWLGLGPTSLTTADTNVNSSTDGVHWSRITGADLPERISLPLASNRNRTQVLGIQYEKHNTFGGRLWATRDGATWEEISSFHKQMPVANPDHLVQSAGWWVLGGNIGVDRGQRRASMWVSPDLQSWYVMPKTMWGPKTDGIAVTVTAAHGHVVGLGNDTHGSVLWVWTAPH